jgi:hypothetical protein
MLYLHTWIHLPIHISRFGSTNLILLHVDNLPGDGHELLVILLHSPLYYVYFPDEIFKKGWPFELKTSVWILHQNLLRAQFLFHLCYPNYFIIGVNLSQHIVDGHRPCIVWTQL